MSKIEDLVAASKLNELIHKKDEEKASKTILWVLAIVGAVAAVAAIAYAVYCFFTPDYLVKRLMDSFLQKINGRKGFTANEKRTGSGRNNRKSRISK